MVWWRPSPFGDPFGCEDRKLAQFCLFFHLKIFFRGNFCFVLGLGKVEVLSDGPAQGVVLVWRCLDFPKLLWSKQKTRATWKSIWTTLIGTPHLPTFLREKLQLFCFSSKNREATHRYKKWDKKNQMALSQELDGKNHQKSKYVWNGIGLTFFWDQWLSFAFSFWENDHFAEVGVKKASFRIPQICSKPRKTGVGCSQNCKVRAYLEGKDNCQQTAEAYNMEIANYLGHPNWVAM